MNGGAALLPRTQAVPLIGREVEQNRLLRVIERHGSLLLTGPHGVGKTRLIESTLEQAGLKDKVVYLSFLPKLHDLLVSLASSLLANRHPSLHQAFKREANPMHALRAQTSVHLRGQLWRAFDEHPCMIVIDGIERASHPVYRFFQRIRFTPGVGIIGTVRSSHLLGSLGRLFWDPREKLELKPLKDSECRTLFDLAIEASPVQGIDIEELRIKILDAAAGNPGAIIEMCHMVSQPQYRAGTYVKFGLMRIDLATRFV